MNKYDDFTADNKQEIKDQVNKHHTIYLYSSFGKGKTHFLKYVQKRYSHHRYKGHTIIFRFSAELHRELSNEIKLEKQGIYEKSIVDKMCECDILLLDDLGNEYMSEFVHEALSVVINHRYLEHKKDNPKNIRTLITSNYSLKELLNVWGEKIGKVKAGQLVRRLRDFGAIEFKGKDWRV